MPLSLYPLFGLSIDPPLPGASDQECALALADSPQLAAAMQLAPALANAADPALGNTPVPVPEPDFSPTPAPGPRR